MDSDELLIELMCEENLDAKREFERRYIAFIKIWLKRYTRVIKYMRMEEDDFVSVLYLKVLDSLSVFDKNNGNFYSFAKTCVNNYMNTFIKRMNGSMRKTILDSISINESINGYNFEEVIEGNYHLSRLDEYVKSREKLFEIKEKIRLLKEEDKKIIKCRYDGDNIKKISSKLSLKEKNVEYKCSSIKKKLTRCIKTKE